ARWIEVLDDLDHRCGVEPCESLVSIHERSMYQLNSVHLMSGKTMEPQPLVGDFQRANRYVHAENLVELAIVHQFPNQFTLAAAEVEHPSRPASPKSREDRAETLLVEA